MKTYTFLLLLLISVSGYAQNAINNYKYVLVPEKFSFLKENNQYRLNALTKALLEEKGFTVYYDNSELPKEIATNKCTALLADVLVKKSMFTTILTLVLKDCQNNIIFKSKEGKSREKEYNTSYNLALRDAFTSLDEIPYAYVASTAVQPQAVVTAPVAATAPIAAIAPATPATPVAPTTPAVPTVSQPTGTLYAQATANGYQLIDTAPKIVLTLFKTSVQDCFIASNGSANGIVLKKNGDWVFEYYNNNLLVSEKLSVKF